MKIVKIVTWTIICIIANLILSVAFAGSAADSRALEFNTYHTNVSPALTNLVNQMIKQKKYHDALMKLDEELAKDPRNTTLLYKKAAIQADLEQWKAGTETLDEILKYQPNHTDAINLRQRLITFKAMQPHNEIGFDETIAYVDDLKAYWQYASLHYYRLTDAGNFGGRINYARRYGTTGKQFQIELYPQLSKHIYVNLILGYANTTQILFPNLQYRIDAYYNTSNGIELALGQGVQKYIRFSNQKIIHYTASVGKYLGNYYFWFRPYYYTPKSTGYFEVGARRYFSDANNYIGLILSSGRLPDIGDLPPIDQMIILKQKTISINSQFSLTKTIFFKLGADYIKQTFPSGLKRDITDGNLGIVWKF